MNFTAYIQKQKNQIRARHEGELFLVSSDGIYPLRPTEEIMREMDGLQGLNVKERQNAAGIFSVRRRACETV